MSAFEVVEAQEAKRLPGKDDRPELAVDHMTLRANGNSFLVTRFRRPDTSIPKPGDMIEGELGDPDKFESGRRKFRASAGRGGRSGPFKRDPGETRAIQRQHSQGCAMQYIAAKAQLGVIKDFDFDDVRKLTDAFEQDINPTPVQSDVPFDDEGLASATKLSGEDGW